MMSDEEVRRYLETGDDDALALLIGREVMANPVFRQIMHEEARRILYGDRSAEKPVGLIPDEA